MTPDQRREHADQPIVHAREPATPWWSARRIRLAALLLCLALCVLALLGSHNGAISVGSASTSPSRGACPPDSPPPLRTVSLAGLASLRASLLPVMQPLARARYAWGIVPAEVAWTDNPPSSIRSSKIDGLWPGSYEMLSWTTDPQLAPAQDDLGASVFLFANATEASRFFAEAATTRCHRDGVERAAARPSGARNLIWVNPDGPTQEDVFLLRSSRVYRVSDVRPQNDARGPTSAQQQAGITRVNSLACALPDASCARP